eukprot:gene9152-11241_t
MKAIFVGKEEIIDLMGIALAGGENLFLHGPPGTAKSALVHELARRLDARSFDYLLTRFTEPSELFGPFDIQYPYVDMFDVNLIEQFLHGNTLDYSQILDLCDIVVNLPMPFLNKG